METTIKTELGERLDQIKYHFKLNNSDLAKIAGVSSQAISDIVNGITDNPKVSTMKNISSKLEISLEWLIEGTGQMKKSKEVANEYKGLNLQDYLSITKENSFLKNVLLKNGIRIEMPNFNPVSGFATVFLGLFFWLY